ncbi:MAG: hypothetical protein IJJ26_03660, partial [Victivallales bacterium]|nr:hypothetical protein [Victivallales bacterium]
AADIAARLLPRSAANNVVDALSSFLRSLSRPDDPMPKSVSLPDGLRALLEEKPVPAPENSRRLGDKPDRIRVLLGEAKTFSSRPETLIVQCAPQSVEEADAQAVVLQGLPPETVVALPQVLYQAQTEAVRRLVLSAVAQDKTIEVNSWDTWHLAKEAGARMEAGPGLQVLNATAARVLQERGCSCASVAMEIDSNQLRDLAAAATTPLSLYIFAYPPLMTTRVQLDPAVYGKPIRDARDIELVPHREGSVTVLRPTRPMDWRGLRDSAVRVAHLVLDLCGVNALPSREAKPFLFNYDRRLR